MAASIRRRQIAVVRQMLNFNEPPDSTSKEPLWKALVYDACGQDVISPLFSVKELRDMDVTLHLLLDTPRDRVPVPAIYFVLPTEENIKRICKDIEDELYDSYYFNFITALPRLKMDDIASTAVATQRTSQIKKVYDQYLNFVSLEEDMFVLRPPEQTTLSYYDLHRGHMADEDMNLMIDTMVQGLFSFFVTIGAIPVIRCPRGSAAEVVSMKLAERMREDLRNPKHSLLNLDSTQQPGMLSFQRPVLILLDRQIDLATPLHHTWTYQALAHDVLSMSFNRVEIIDSPTPEGAAAAPESKEKKKSYDLNSSDKLWQQLRGRPFPEVAEAIQEELDAYKAQEGEISRLKAAMGLSEGDDGAMGTLTDTTAQLTSTVSSLPELLEKKRLIDLHTNVATALLDRIKSRKLDVYFETEEKLMSKTALDKSLLDIIQDPAGLTEDKLRLLVIACLSDLGEAEVSRYAEELLQAGCDVSALAYVKRNKNFGSLTAAARDLQSGGGPKTVSMFGKLVSQASQFAMEGVKNLVPKTRKLPVTRITDALMEGKNLSDLENYFYDDPKMIRKLDTSASAPAKSRHSEAVVFVVGGGNYIEYQNLQDYAKDSKRIFYGCSQLLSASQFLSQVFAKLPHSFLTCCLEGKGTDCGLSQHWHDT